MQLPEPFAGWLAGRGWRLRRHQARMLTAARRGEHALLVAPTGSGKTLAGFLPSLLELAPGGGHGLHSLYVSPLKALAVDIGRNLEAPIAEMGLQVRVETRTGDTPQAKRRRQRMRLPDILLTTPESLSLLLSYADAGRLFRGLRCVILDELHALAPNKRGDLLALALARLADLAPGCRRVGLSATVSEPEAYRRWLAPDGEASSVRLVQAGRGARPRIRILAPERRIPWSGHMALHGLPEIYVAIRAHRTTLVFVNTRAQAEIVFQGLWRLNDDKLPIALHHGSLDREQRRRVEAVMARGGLRAVVATSSLDLGIDWGDVDLVVQLGAPKGAARLIQRIGRANHRMDAPSEALILPGNRFEHLESQAAVTAVRARELDGEALRPGGLDVLAQHLIATACSAPFLPEEAYDQVRRAAPYGALARKRFDEVLDFVSNGGYALKAYERYRKLVPDAAGRYRIASPRVARQYRMNAGVIVEAPTLAVRLGRGRRLGRVEEYFAMGLEPGDSFVFAGRLLSFVEIRDMEVVATTVRTGGAPKVPAYVGGRLPLTTNLARRVRQILADPAAWRGLPAEVRAWLAEQQQRSELPGPEGLLVESFPRGAGRRVRHYTVAYPFEGRNAHQTLGMLLTRRMERAGLKPMGFVATDYVIGLWSLEPPRDVAALFGQDMLEDDLEEWMAESSMLRRTFRNVAVIAGLIDRRHPGEHKSKRQITFSSDLIYDVLRRYQPDHLLLRATREDAKGNLTDIARLAEMLARVEGKIRHVALDRVSPLALPVLLEIGRESVMGEADEDILAREAALIAEAGLGA